MTDTTDRSLAAVSAPPSGFAGRINRAADSEAVLPVTIWLTLLFLIVFIGYPIAYNLIMSFQDVTIGNLTQTWRPWAGLDNYRAVVTDPLFGKVVLNTIVFVGGNVLLSFLLGFALALFFDLGFPGAGWFRGLMLAGWVLPPMVIGAVFKWILSTEFGVLNELLTGLGLVAERIHWLSDPDKALAAVIMANVWFGTPFVMILLSAGLSTLPDDLYEAAALDGAGRVRRLTHITLPLMKPTILAVLALSTIYSMRVFDLLWTMTRGGPLDATNILPLWSYLFSFEFFRFGQGAAVASLMFVIVFFVALLYVRSLKSEHRL